ncbi:hypothetical protein BROUX41_003923 [Berkeleyomyces rouxiae]
MNTDVLRQIFLQAHTFGSPYALNNKAQASAGNLEQIPGTTAHDVYHADRLRSAANDAFPSQKTHDDRPAPMGVINGEEYWEVEKILGERTSNGVKQVKVKWKGYVRPGWEPVDLLVDTDAYKLWLSQKGTKTTRKRRKRG